jgi:prepilin-type N-terminal cleavage/methylation domain-containing protein/prepilin-type processing-associated H-X9-DG protein
MKLTVPYTNPRSGCRRGFSLVELLVVIAIIGVLAALLMPALGGSSSRGRSVSCLSNLKQLQTGWLMYAHDNNETLVPNISRRIGLDQINVAVDGRVPWVLGNAKVDTNTVNIETGSLFRHVGSAAVYRCPADRSTVRSSAATRRTRSYSTHEWFNCDVQTATPLDGVNDSALNLRKASQIVDPGPSRTWVFIDENEMSIDDGIFGIGNPWPGDPRVDHDFWDAYPADRHDDGANLSFADGHVEHHRWRFHRTITFYTGGKTFVRKDNTNDLADLHWLQEGIPHRP